MRIKLAAGKQRELIELAKNSKTWKELSQILNLAEGYIRNELRYEYRILSENSYRELCSLTGKNFSAFIVETFKDSWGQSKGGIISRGKTKEVFFPKESVKLAEFFGIMLGDGNLTKLKSYKVGTYQIRIVGDSRHDKNYLVYYVKPLIEELFNIRVGVMKHKNQNAISLYCTSRELSNFLEEKGFKPGDKIKNQLTIPSWIKKDNDFLRKCLRGLYDTDGSIYKLTNQNTYQICFTSHNPVLLKDVRNFLLGFDIKVSKLVDNRKIYLTKRSELQRFLKLVGFSNRKHLDKVRKWNLAL